MNIERPVGDRTDFAALSTRIELKLSPLITQKVVGACHFARFYDAMDAAQHLVTLDPTAVELVDRTKIELARDIDMFRPTVERFVAGDPDALLLVEFGEDDQAENLRRRRMVRFRHLHPSSAAIVANVGINWTTRKILN